MKKSIPHALQSPDDARALSRAIAKMKIKAIGVYTKDTLVVLTCLIVGAFAIAMDYVISTQIGRHYFEPLPGETSTSMFGSKTILAAVLLSAMALHIAALGKKRSRMLALLDEYAPKFAMVFIGGTALLLVATMAGQIIPMDTGGWGEQDESVVASLLNWFNTEFLDPLAQQAFAIGFGSVLVSSVFALSKLSEWMFDAIARIVAKSTMHRPIMEAAGEIKTKRIEYRQKAAMYNSMVARPANELEQEFALLVYQVCAPVVRELRKQVNRKPNQQFPSFQSPCSDMDAQTLRALRKSCQYNTILAAVRGENLGSKTTSNGSEQ